ncbi:MAG: methionyl-tRNA formyltransferase [Bacteroidia bacterium]
MRIALLCNDRLALPALNYLAAKKNVIAAGVTDRVSETQLHVRQMCKQAGVPLMQFGKKDFNEQLKNWLLEYKPDVVLVKTFPFRIPADSLAIPKQGFINFHYAPLPEWRGSNPLFWMIRNRATEAGVCVHKMNRDFDSGDIILQHHIPLSKETTFGLLCTQLAYLGVELTQVLLQQMSQGTLNSVEQDNSKAKWYGRPKPADLFINWNTMDAEEICALAKACNPWNKGAATTGNGWVFGISEASIVTQVVTQNLQPGTIIELNEETGLLIACRDNKVIEAEVIYCEEGFFPGKKLTFFGLKKGLQLGK